MTATSTETVLVLPDILRDHRRDLERALATHMPMGFADGVTYQDAAQPRAIGEVLVDAVHVDLVNARIGYVFREKIAKGDYTVLGRASKVGGKLEFFSELDLLIEINWSTWMLMKPLQRIALVDHELSHFARTETETGETRYIVIPHDIEEFGGIVKRWGLWTLSVKQFALALEAAGQLGLFEPKEAQKDA